MMVNFFIQEIFDRFVEPHMLIYRIRKDWVLLTFTKVFESLINDYRSDRYKDVQAQL